MTEPLSELVRALLNPHAVSKHWFCKSSQSADGLTQEVRDHTAEYQDTKGLTPRALCEKKKNPLRTFLNGCKIIYRLIYIVK